MSGSPTIDEVLTELRAHGYRFACEKDLQSGVETVLKRRRWTYAREHQLTSRDRPDFFLNSIALELKIKGSLTEVTRQLHRYAQHPSVEAIILMTSRSRHRGVPRVLNEKPVHVVYLGLDAF